MGDAPQPEKNRVTQLREELQNAPVVADPAPQDLSQAKGHDMGPEDTPPPEQTAPDPDGPGRSWDRPYGEIFDGSPVRALGVEADHSYYLDTLGQLRRCSNHTAQAILSIFGKQLGLLCHEFPSFDKNGEAVAGKFNSQRASMAMIQACGERGLFNPDRAIRGPGAWCDSDGNLIYHAGEEILIDGEWHPPGFHDGKLYPASPPIPRPAQGQPNRDPAEVLLDMLGTWNWRRPDIDPQLMLGTITSQMVGGALEWRPVTWLTGDAATGKSTLQKLLSYVHGGEDGLLQAADATGAAIRTILKQSSRPVALDEFEPDPDNPAKNKAVIELARQAASGAQVIRGSSDQKGHQFNLYSCFLFSSILIPHMPAQDLSRLITLNLDKIEGGTPPKLDPRALRSLGAHLKRRLIDAWPTWSERLELWRGALAEAGHAGRGADNYGTTLAAADAVLMPDDLPTPDRLNAWARKMVTAIQDDGSEDSGSNAENMVLHLVGQELDPWRRGQRYSVADFIMAAAGMPDAPSALQADQANYEDPVAKAKEANRVLARYGLRVRGYRDTAQLFFPRKALPSLCDLFEGSEWAKGVWFQAAERLPKADRVSLTLSGVSTRGVYVPLTTIPGLAMSSVEDRPTMPPPPEATHPAPEDLC
ncbi:MAG: hypothetical protein AAFY65_01295 [Pseudomonadota bacterium]